MCLRFGTISIHNYVFYSTFALVYYIRLITDHRAGGPLLEGPARAFGHRPYRPLSAFPGTVLSAQQEARPRPDSPNQGTSKGVPLPASGNRVLFCDSQTPKCLKVERNGPRNLKIEIVNHASTNCKNINISYVPGYPELRSITYPVSIPGRVGAKILGSTGKAAQ